MASADKNIILPSNNQKSEEIEEKIKNILTNCVSPMDRMMYASDNNHLNLDYLITNYSKLIYNYNLRNYATFEPFWTRYIPVNVYFLVITSTTIIDMLKQLHEWNSRAKFIIYFTNQTKSSLEDLFKYLKDFYIYNVIIITSNSLVYTYYPYKEENINKPDLTPVLIQIGEYFPNKVPKTWRNSSIIVMTNAKPPFLDYLDGIKYDGIDYRLMEFVFQPYFQFHHQYIFEFRGYGSLVNGSYTLLLNRLYNREADLALGGLELTLVPLAIDFDITYPFIDDETIWYVPTPPIVSHTMNLTRLFSPHIWASIAGMIVISCIFWGIFGKIAPEEERFFRPFWNSCVMPLRFLFNEVPPHNPRRKSIKTLYIFTWLFIFMINVCWEARLIVTMTYTNREAPISSLQDIIDRNINISMMSSNANLYRNTGGKIGQIVYERNVAISVYNEYTLNYMRIVAKKDLVSIGTRSLLQYVKVYGIFGNRVDIGIQTIEEKLNHYYLPHYFIKGHPMYEGYNEVMNWIRASGVSNMFLDHFYHGLSIKREKKIKFVEKAMHHILKMEHLSLAFYLWICGLNIAFVVFVFEKILYRRNNENINVVH